MKKIVILLSLIILFNLFAGCKVDKIITKKDEFYEEEFYIVGVYEDKSIIKCIEDIYVSHTTFKVLSRAIYAKDIMRFLDIPNGENIARGNYVFKTEARTFVLTFNEEKLLIDMLNISNKDISLKEFNKVKRGYTWVDVSKIDPSIIINHKVSMLLNEEQPLLDIPISEHILSDGSIGIIEYEYVDGDYIVKDKYVMPAEFDKSFLKQLKEL